VKTASRTTAPPFSRINGGQAKRPGILTRFTRAWTMPLYRLLYDPDGRPIKVRMRRSF
jgi:hypothetical protein